MAKRLLIVVIAVAVFAVGLRHLYLTGLEARDPAGTQKLVYLQPGQGLWALASVLEDEGIIRSAPAFYVSTSVHPPRRR